MMLVLAAWAVPAEPIEIRMMGGAFLGIPPPEAIDARSMARRAVFEEFHRLNPDIRVVNAGGLELAGDRAESGFLMSMAGDTAPDVFYINFRQYYNFIDQGFTRPLDDLIARTPSVMERVHPTILEVLQSYDGQIYALPFFTVAQALYYRKDVFYEAGLDPNRPPQTWEEFYQFGQQIVERVPGTHGFAFASGVGGKAYHWTNFVWQAGGEVVKPAEGGYWTAAVDSPEGAVALDFFRKLTMERWRGESGRTYGPMANLTADMAADIRDGRLAMWFSYTNDVMMNMSDLHPSLLGIAAMPAGPAGRANEINAGMWAINATITDPDRIDAAWRFIQFFVGDQAARVQTERFVEMGLGTLVNPVLLKRFGFEDIAARVDPSYVAASESLFETGHPEPYGRNMTQVYVVLDAALDRARLEPNTPSAVILREVALDMDQKLLGYTPPEVLQHQRMIAFWVVVAISIVVLSIVIWALWGYLQNRTDEPFYISRPAGQRSGWAWFGLLLAPAALSVFVWSYYPLFHGLVIAFQDYRIIQGTRWVGLDNFISVFTNELFYRSIFNAFLFVGLTIGIGFFIPVFLALALNEIPKWKLFFRTVFFLPAMTSPIVIAFLWRQFYDRTEEGVLNMVLAPFIDAINWAITPMGFQALSRTNDWLGDPSLAMFAVVLPGIWAGAGPGSILYLAALKNIPDERYEAADIDGASWKHKVLFITLPGLKPLLLINLLGAFIGGFKAMETIFVMTGGGPMHATHTIGMEIWTNAFMFLQFGYATAAAWVMGAILIGFTLVQIRNLTRMKFSTAKF